MRNSANGAKNLRHALKHGENACDGIELVYGQAALVVKEMSQLCRPAM
jgi:hypothetical protein